MNNIYDLKVGDTVFYGELIYNKVTIGETKIIKIERHPCRSDINFVYVDATTWPFETFGKQKLKSMYPAAMLGRGHSLMASLSMDSIKKYFKEIIESEIDYTKENIKRTRKSLNTLIKKEKLLKEQCDKLNQQQNEQKQ